MLRLSAAAVALTAGLIFASIILAAQTAPAQPTAQMNRALYPAITIAGHPYVPTHRARHSKPAPMPTAQMNRAFYTR